MAERQGDLGQLYLAVIQRYKDYIEEQESLSVAELPTLVTPNNEKVAAKAKEVMDDFDHYTYEGSFYDASVEALEFVRDKIADATLPLQFWLSPADTLTFGMGDIVDKCVLLCSLLIKLGNPSAKVLMSIRDSTRNVLVYYEYSGKLYLLDMKDGIRELPGKDAMLKALGIDENSTAYEFNDKMYVDIV
jgi:hypothetical protein